jgi:hypothetical protein
VCEAAPVRNTAGDATEEQKVVRVIGQNRIQLFLRNVSMSNSFLAKICVAKHRDSTNSISVADISQILNAVEAGEQKAAAQLLPLVYTEMRLRFFGGVTVEESAPIIGVAPRTAERLWVFARAWLRSAMDAASEP